MWLQKYLDEFLPTPPLSFVRARLLKRNLYEYLKFVHTRGGVLFNYIAYSMSILSINNMHAYLKFVPGCVHYLIILLTVCPYCLF